jgi:hypothetical protein
MGIARQFSGGKSMRDGRERRRQGLKSGNAYVRITRSNGTYLATRFGEVWMDTRSLYFPPSFHRLQHGDLIGIFDVAPYWDPHRNPRNAQALSSQLVRQLGGGGLAFNGGISR